MMANTFPALQTIPLQAGWILTAGPGYFLHLTYYYSDKMPLNDANTAYADAYQFSGGRIGYILRC